MNSNYTNLQQSMYSIYTTMNVILKLIMIQTYNNEYIALISFVSLIIHYQKFSIFLEGNQLQLSCHISLLPVKKISITYIYNTNDTNF